MRRIVGSMAIVLAALTGAACSSEQGSKSDGGVDAGDNGSDSGDNGDPSGSDTSDSGDTGDSGDGGTSEPDASASLPPDDGSGDGSTDPALAELNKLEPEAVCALLPAEDVVAVTGVAVGPGDGLKIDGLGTNCLYYADNGSGADLVAKLEFDILSWSDVKALSEFSVEGTPDSESCSIAGLEAICTPSYEIDGITLGAIVSVKLGSDADPSVSVTSDLGLDQAKALAELVVPRI